MRTLRQVLQGALPAVFVASCATATVTGAVDRKEWVDVEGVALYLHTRGRDARAPVLLWLHGGPGGPERPLFRFFNGELEKRFVVAYWDQRGAGNSAKRSGHAPELTIERHLLDLDAVVDHLRATLETDRVVLVGHSWGSALGLLYAQAHPAKIGAFAGVGQVVATLEGQRRQRAFVEAQARAAGDDRVLDALEALGPPPFEAAEELEVQRWVDRYGGLFHSRPNMTWTLVRLAFGGYVAPWDVPGYFRANERSLEAMNAELAALDLRERVTAVEVPVVFLLGRHDRHTDSTLAADYFDRLTAPCKRLVWFEDSAHNVPFEEPEAFNARLHRALAECRALGEDGASATAEPPRPDHSHSIVAGGLDETS